MANDKNIEEGIGSSNDQDVSSASSDNGESSNRNNRGKRRVREDDIEEEIAPKKAKIVWTNPLHNRFLLALHHLGLDKAVPKKILEFMNVPGLTRENVASHLQKYRMFLKKVAEKGLWQSQTMSEKLLRSSFATGYNPHRNALSFPSAAGNSAALGLSRYPNFTHEASSSTAPPPFRHGQSSLLAANRPNLMLGNYGHQNTARFGMPNNNGFPTTPLSMFQPNQTVGSNFGNPNYSSLNAGNGSGGGLFPPYNSGNSFAGIRLNGNQLGAGQMGATFGADSASSPNFGYGFGNQIPNPNLAGSSSGINPGAGNSFTGNGMSDFVPNNAGFASSSSGTFGDFLGQGGPSSSSMFGFRANNLVSMAFNGPNDQGLSAIFNGTPNRSASAENSGGSEFPFSLLNDVSGPGSSSNSQHVELDDHDLNLFFGSTQFQQQNGGNAMNFEINTNDFLNAEFSNSCSLVDKAPWTQQSSPESGEGSGNANTGSNSNSMDSFFLQSGEGTGNANTGSSSNSIDSFFHQSQSSPEEAMASDLNLTGQSASPPSDENQSFGDDLLDMLLSDHPF